MIKQKINTYGDSDNKVRVKKVIKRGFCPYWVAGGKLTSDNGIVKVTLPCGDGGFVALSEKSAVLGLIDRFLAHLDTSGNIPPTFSFTKAREVLEGIRKSF